VASPEEQSVDQALAVWRACENGSEIYASDLVSRAAAVLEKGGYNQVRFDVMMKLGWSWLIKVVWWFRRSERLDWVW